MGLSITKLTLDDFRNWDSFEVEPHPSLTVFVGPNAVGKTSIIEAIQLLTETVSFRRPAWVDTVRWGSEEATLTLQAEGDGRLMETRLEITAAGKRTYRVNGKVRKRLTEVSGVIPCVTFTPDDLGLVKNAAETRRSSIDSIGAQLSPTYAKARNEYERIVRQRNTLLRDGAADTRSLAALDTLLIEGGSRLLNYRLRLFGRLKGPIARVYGLLATGEELTVAYLTSWERDGAVYEGQPPEEAMRCHLQARRPEEIARKKSLVGPHRDDISFFINGKTARSFGSQGQQRTIALSWKLAEVEVMRDIAAQPPVLLLDDVMSELDQTRRDALASLVGSAAQTFVTTTNLGYFDDSLIQRSLVVNLA